MFFRTLKSQQTLKAHGFGGVLTSSNLYCSRLGERVIKLSLSSRDISTRDTSCGALKENLNEWKLFKDLNYNEENMPPMLPLAGEASLAIKTGRHAINQRTISEKRALDPNNNFNKLESISPLLKKAIVQDFGFTKMSLVQEKVLNLPLHQDLFVRAKTGTGKTMAFLIYAIQSVLNKGGFSNDSTIPILVIAPTRELALQISSEATKLVRHLNLRVATSVGGLPRSRAVMDVGHRKCDIFVCSPGRLNDLIQNEASIREKLQGLQTLVLDEADMMLDMGFQKDLNTILSLLPQEQRNTLLFSATVTQSIQQVASETFSQPYKYIDCVPRNEVDTHMKIRQSYVIVRFKEQLYMLVDMITKHKKSNPLAKIIVFLPTTFNAEFCAHVLNNMPELQTLLIHSKLTQQQRTQISKKFRACRSGILVTTDISARGVDYPNVSLVVQLGMPSNREQYIHRIGRTGRADKEGQGILILSPYEANYLKCLGGVPIRQELRYDSSFNAQEKAIALAIENSVKSIDRKIKTQACLSFLSFHLNHTSTSGMRKDTIVKAALEFAPSFVGLTFFPSVSQVYAQRMGFGINSGLPIHRQEPQPVAPRKAPSSIKLPKDWSKAFHKR